MMNFSFILISLLTLFIHHSSNIVAYAKDKNSKNSFPNPCAFNCDNNDKSSPWKFHLNFEDNSWKGKLTPNDKGMGWVPFKIMEEDGNKFLSITVKDGWNSYKGKRNIPTERSELQTAKRKSFGKEVWYGFKIRKPVETPFINDRMLITQFKQRTRTKPSPMISMGRRQHNKNFISISICGKSGKWGSHMSIYNFDAPIKLTCNKKHVQSELKFNNTKDFQNFITTKWKTLVIGGYVTNTNNGYMKVYLNQNLIYNYKGPTYGWSNVVGSNVRIGIYRDGNSEKGYPPQTLHYDDFVIGSKDDVTNFLWK
jgi:hypothetical protein